MEVACDYNAKNSKYVQRVLKNWQTKGIKTLVEAERAIAEHEQSKGGNKGYGQSGKGFTGDPEELKPKNTVGKTVEQLMREMQ